MAETLKKYSYANSPGKPAPDRAGKRTYEVTAGRSHYGTRNNCPAGLRTYRAIPLKSGPPSLGLDICRLYNWPPFFGLCPLVRAERLRRLSFAWRNLLSEFGEPLTHSRIGQGIHNRGIEFRDNRRRRVFWRPHPVPNGNVKAGQPRFIHGRNLRRCRQPCLGGHGISLDPAGPHLWDGIRRLIEQEVNSARYQIQHRRSAAAIRYKLKVGPGHFLKINADDMRWTAGDRGPLRGFTRVLFQPFEQFLLIVRCHLFFCVDKLRIAREQRDRRKII